jgi:hypothetical protein
MPASHFTGKRVPLNGLSLDLGTFSAMSYFASEMNMTLNDAIGLALTQWLLDGNREQFADDFQADVKSLQN